MKGDGRHLGVRPKGIFRSCLILGGIDRSICKIPRAPSVIWRCFQCHSTCGREALWHGCSPRLEAFQNFIMGAGLQEMGPTDSSYAWWSTASTTCLPCNDLA